MSLTSGTRLGPYEILSQIGKGGMGEVFRARFTKLGREVAITLLPGRRIHHTHLSRFVCLIATVLTGLHAHLGVAQVGAVRNCSTAVLYDSAERIFRIESGVGTPESVYAEITGPGSGASKPHLAPGGGTLAWVRFLPDSGTPPSIWMTSVEGGESWPLTPGMSSDQPAWSPDGTRIAFTSWRQGADGLVSDLYVIGVDGKELHQLTDNEFRDEFAAWSPDGERIAYGSLRNDNFDVFVVRSDGSAVRQITDHPATDFRPAWSPDGEWIAFASSRHDFDEVDTYDFDLYLMRPDGSEVQRLTYHPPPLLALRPSWSPQGDELVYQVGGAAADESDWEIYRVAVEGGEPHRLTNNSVTDAHPDWNTFQLECRLK